MRDQEKSFSIYTKPAGMHPILLAVGFVSVMFWAYNYLVDSYYIGWSALKWWQLLTCIAIPFLVIFVMIIGYRMAQNSMQKEPELIFNEQGIMIHRLGFVSWHDIQKVDIFIGSGRQRSCDLLIQLNATSAWRPLLKRYFGISLFFERNRTLSIDLNYLNTTPQQIVDIYELLMKSVDRLREIDHAGLYEN